MGVEAILFPANSGGKPLEPDRFPKLFFKFCSALCLILASINPAKAEINLGFVDIPFLIDKAPQALEAAGRLESEFAPRQISISEQRSSLEGLKSELDDHGFAMNPSELTQLERQIQRLERKVRRDEKEFREQLNIRKNTEFKKIRLIVLDAIDEFGKENGYDLIVSDGVLFAKETVDITSRILEKLRLKNSDQIKPDR